MANPPFTEAMMSVSDHEDSVDTRDTMARTGFKKRTSLESMLVFVFDAKKDVSIKMED